MTTPDLQALQGTLRRAGVRVTHPRLMVLGVLLDEPGRTLAASDLYREMLRRNCPLSLSTIYSVLTTLRRTRLVSSAISDSGSQVFMLTGR